MSSQLMDLVRELKGLNARKKAGEALSDKDENRRKELKVYLKSALGQTGGDDETSMPAGARPAAPGSTMPPQRAPAPQAPTAPPPRPAPAPIASAPPARPAPAPVAMSTPPAAAPRPLSSTPPAAAPAPPKFVPRKDAFMIAGADDIIDAAASSEAVARVDMSSKASAVEIADAEAKADAAARANKKLARAVTPDEVERQLREAAGAYTPPADTFTFEQYYGAYADDGYVMAASVDAPDLRPIDPRELEVQRLTMDVTARPGGGSSSVTVPPGLAFLDDFAALYARRVLPPPSDETPDEGGDDPSLLISRRKVMVHLVNGEKKQGTVRALRRGEMGFKLEGPGGAEEIGIAQVKAVFVLLQPNAQPPPQEGRSLTVVFKDSRSVQGASSDYAPGVAAFTLVPPAGRGQFEKIIVNAGAVQSVQ